MNTLTSHPELVSAGKLPEKTLVSSKETRRELFKDVMSFARQLFDASDEFDRFMLYILIKNIHKVIDYIKAKPEITQEDFPYGFVLLAQHYSKLYGDQFDIPEALDFDSILPQNIHYYNEEFTYDNLIQLVDDMTPQTKFLLRNGYIRGRLLFNRIRVIEIDKKIIKKKDQEMDDMDKGCTIGSFHDKWGISMLIPDEDKTLRHEFAHMIWRAIHGPENDEDNSEFSQKSLDSFLSMFKNELFAYATGDFHIYMMSMLKIGYYKDKPKFGMSEEEWEKLYKELESFISSFSQFLLFHTVQLLSDSEEANYNRMRIQILQFVYTIKTIEDMSFSVVGWNEKFAEFLAKQK